jgi:CarD family transcriptional regulator
MPQIAVAPSTALHGPALPGLMPEGVSRGLAVGDAVVHPAHGVGRFDGVEAGDVDGARLELMRIIFAERRLTLRVPVGKADRAGLRRPMAPEAVVLVLAVIAGAPRPRRGIWARRLIELGAKLNSGDPFAVAEVLRDLARGAGRPDQPNGERMMLDQAIDRLAGEIAAVEGITKPEAALRILAAMRAPHDA